MNDKYYMNENFKLLNSICITEYNVYLRWKYIGGKKETTQTETIGIDPGIRKILSLSDGTFTPKTNSQGKTFQDIIDKINRKEKDSKAYKKALIERDNYLREVINNTPFNAKEIRFEYNKYLKRNTGNANHHWAYSVVVVQVIKKCENDQVDLTFTKSAYKSQRCSECSYVHKLNRVNEVFCCLNCGHTEDADTNSSENNSIKLEAINVGAVDNKINGFFWYPLSYCPPVKRRV
jgi:transposase